MENSTWNNLIETPCSVSGCPSANFVFSPRTPTKVLLKQLFRPNTDHFGTRNKPKVATWVPSSYMMSSQSFCALPQLFKIFPRP
jgi:hypothetical protein